MKSVKRYKWVLRKERQSLMRDCNGRLSDDRQLLERVSDDRHQRERQWVLCAAAIYTVCVTVREHSRSFCERGSDSLVRLNVGLNAWLVAFIHWLTSSAAMLWIVWLNGLIANYNGFQVIQ